MIRLGIICPSEIALRRFMPAVSDIKEIEYVGVAIASPEEWFGDSISQIEKSDVEKVLASERQKAEVFQTEFGGTIFTSYSDLVNSDMVDAIYLPLPPALHHIWGKAVLQSGKHLFSEKPFTTSLEDSEELIKLASDKNLAVHENYMFAFHSQIEEIMEIVNSGDIGDIRLIRVDFGFPRRAQNDFRYNRKLGGGALLDCGGYPIKLAGMLLGDSPALTYASSGVVDGFEVDIYGNAALINNSGSVAQISFGMDNDYRCNLDIWGSKGSVFSNRILTAPAGFVPEVTVKNANGTEVRQLRDDDSFKKSIKYFVKCIEDTETRLYTKNNILNQAKLVEDFRVLSGMANDVRGK